MIIHILHKKKLEYGLKGFQHREFGMQDFTTESAVAGLIIPGHASKINEWHSDPWTQVPTLLAFCKGHISAFHMQSKKKKKTFVP